MPEFEKSKKTMKIFMLVMGILQVLSLVLTLTNEFNVVSLIFGLVYVGLYVAGFLSAQKGTKMAGIAGIVMGCVLIATILLMDILDCVVGIFMLIEAIKYNKLYKQIEQGGAVQTAAPTQPVQPVQTPSAPDMMAQPTMPAQPVAPVVPENPMQQPVDNNQNNQPL